MGENESICICLLAVSLARGGGLANRPSERLVTEVYNCVSWLWGAWMGLHDEVCRQMVIEAQVSGRLLHSNIKCMAEIDRAAILG